MRLEHLPVEILVFICTHLVPINIFNVSVCSHHLYTICQDDNIWKYIGLRYGIIVHHNDTILSWKKHVLNFCKFTHVQLCVIKLIQQLFPSYIHDMRTYTTFFHYYKQIPFTHIIILIDKYNRNNSNSTWINVHHQLEIKLFILCSVVKYNTDTWCLFELCMDRNRKLYTLCTKYTISDQCKTDLINNNTSPFNSGTCIYLNKIQLDRLKYQTL